MKLDCSLKAAKDAIVEEAADMWNGIRNQRLTIGFLFAIICVFIVIVGNVILLIGLNFWLVVFPTDNLAHNSSQIAIQVVATLLMVLFFAGAMALFVAVFGGVPIWRALTDTNRMGHPAYRLFLLFASGASNGLCGVTGVYSMSHTPEFLQAVLLCCIPFSAQAWTVIFIPEERKRDYLSLFFVGSALMLVAGILLSSMTAFLDEGAHAARASWEWALVYLLSSVLFGLWCVVQRLYLDAMIVREGCERPEALEENAKSGPKRDTLGIAGEHLGAGAHELHRGGLTVGEGSGEVAEGASAAVLPGGAREEQQQQQQQQQQATASSTGTNEPYSALSKLRSQTQPSNARPAAVDFHDDVDDDDVGYEDEYEREMASQTALLLAEKRSWARQSVNDNAAKLVLLFGGLLFQLFISFVVFPVDAIPWFGTSTSASEAWRGFANSVSFIFASWHNIRYGLLYTLGYIMSFIGCTFLNEHSPTLASVVLQLAGPITSLVILIIPQWNVYKDSGNVGHKVGGVILLIAAAFLYHVWEQRSLREMVQRAHRKEEERRQREAAAEEAAAVRLVTGEEP